MGRIGFALLLVILLTSPIFAEDRCEDSKYWIADPRGTEEHIEYVKDFKGTPVG